MIRKADIWGWDRLRGGDKIGQMSSIKTKDKDKTKAKDEDKKHWYLNLDELNQCGDKLSKIVHMQLGVIDTKKAYMIIFWGIW